MDVGVQNLRAVVSVCQVFLETFESFYDRNAITKVYEKAPFFSLHSHHAFAVAGLLSFYHFRPLYLDRS
jgi:hypothetical protein